MEARKKSGAGQDDVYVPKWPRNSKLSVASCQLSVASCELSVDFCQLSVGFCQLLFCK